MIIDSNGKNKFREHKSEDSLTIAFAGDCCPHHSAVDVIKKGSSSDILRDIKPIFDKADLSIIQFETPLTNSEIPLLKSGPNLKCPPECVDFVTAGGFDVALLANNHTGDYGPDAVMETVEILNQNGVKTVGAGKDLKEACKPLIIEKKGYKIGIINVTEHEFGTAGETTPGAAPLEPVENMMSIAKLSKDVDIIIVVTHGGNETNPFPSPRAIRNARAFADAGADAVINIHTHCPQGIELWNDTPIVYCPGNFFFPWDGREFNRESFWWSGYVPVLEFDKSGALSIEIIPYTFYQDPLKIVPFNESEKEQFCRYMSDISEVLADGNKIRKFHDAWCAMKGPYMVTSMGNYFEAASPIDYKSPETAKGILPLRNRFTCESHHELISNFLRVIEEGRLDEAEQLIPTLQSLQKATFLKSV